MLNRQKYRIHKKKKVADDFSDPKDDKTFHQTFPVQDTIEVDAVVPQSSNLKSDTLASPIIREKEEVPTAVPEVVGVFAPVTPLSLVSAEVESSSLIVAEKVSSAPQVILLSDLGSIFCTSKPKRKEIRLVK